VNVGGCDYHRLEVKELGLPRSGFAALTATLLPGSGVEVLYADVDMADIEQLLPGLDEWAVDRLRVVSPRLQEPFEWVGSWRSRSEVISEPTARKLTAWEQLPQDHLRFVRSIDLSTLGELPVNGTLSGSNFLESVILPAQLRILPSRVFERCPRLSHVGTTDCVSLVRIGWHSFQDCRNLRQFVFPSMVRAVSAAFGGTSIVCLDLSGTRVESIDARGMKFLERLVLPRGCTLEGALGLPALRSVTFGVSGELCGWTPCEVRFESLAAPVKGRPQAAGTRAFAEVACVLGRESFPFPP
jgi:hypothetical protein